MSDYKGAALLLDSLPKARELLADRGYDADWFRNALIEKGITLVIASIIDTVIALQVQSCRTHRLISRARDFLAWASTAGLNLIDRAYALINDQISSGYMSIRPDPLDLSSLNTGKVVPPYTWLCTDDQLGACPNKPFWVA